MPGKFLSTRPQVSFNYFLPLFFIFGLALLLTCSFEKPSAPTWEVELTIPLINKTFTMSELVEDEKHLYADSIGNVYFQFEKKIDRYTVDGRLKLDSLSQTFESDLGSFTISPPGVRKTYISLGQINEEVAQNSGVDSIVLPFDLTPSTQEFPVYENFEYVKIDSGEAVITLVNNLPIPLGSPIYLSLKETTGKTIGQVSFNREIEPGDSATAALDLSGKMISHALAVEISGTSPGSRGEIIYIDADVTMELKVDIGELKVSEAKARIPAQQVRQVNTFAIKDSMVITEAEVKKGTIELYIDGSLPVNVMVSYEFPDFVDDSGKSLKESIYIPAAQRIYKSIPLEHHTLRPQEAGRLGEQNLQFHWTFRTEDTSPYLVELHKEDFMRAEVNLSQVQLTRIFGIIKAIAIDIDPIHEKIKLPSGLDKILLDDARLELTFTNGINFPVKSDLTVQGENESGTVIPLEIEQDIQAAPQPGTAEETTIILDKNNSSIVDFINALPTQIKIFGNVVLGQDNWHGTVTSNDFVEGFMKISSPLSLSLPSQEITTEVSTTKIKEATREQIRDNLLSGGLYGSVTNHFPLGASVTINIARIDSNVFTNPELTIPLEVESGQLDGPEGTVNTPSVTPVLNELDKNELRIFEHSPIYTGLLINLPGTAGNKVKTVTADFLKVSVCARVKVKVDFDKNEE